MCGGIGDAIGDVVGGVSDAVGDVVGGVADVAGDLAGVAAPIAALTGNPWVSAGLRVGGMVMDYTQAQDAEAQASRAASQQRAAAQAQYEAYLEQLDFQLEKERDIYLRTKDKIWENYGAKSKALDFQEADIERVYQQTRESIERTRGHAQTRLEQYAQARDTAVNEAERVYDAVVAQQQDAIESAETSADLQIGTLEDRESQAGVQSREQQFRARIENHAAKGEIAASAGFRGVTGGTVARALLDVDTGTGIDVGVLQRNLSNFRQQIGRDIQGVQAQRDARIDQAEGAIGQAGAQRDSRTNQALSQYNMLESDIENLMNELDSRMNFTTSEYQSDLNQLQTRRNQLVSDRDQSLEDSQTRWDFAKQAREQGIETSQADLQTQFAQAERYLAQNEAPGAWSYVFNTANDLLTMADQNDWFGDEE